MPGGFEREDNPRYDPDLHIGSALRPEWSSGEPKLKILQRTGIEGQEEDHLLKSLAIYFFADLIARMGSLMLLPIYTRNLDPSDYGILELLNRATDILLLCLFLNGLCLAAISFYHQAPSEESRRRVVGSVLVCGSFFIGLIGLAAVTLAGPIAALTGVGNTGLVRLAFLAALGEALVCLCLALNQAREEATRYTTITMIGVLLRVGLIAVFLCLFRWGVAGILLASLIVSATLGLVLVTLEVKRSGLQFDRATAAGMAWFALPFLPGGICGFLLGSGDQFFLAQCASTTQIGLYALGYKLATMVSLFTLGPFMKIWGARIYRVAREPGAQQSFGRVFTRFTSAYLLVGLGAALFGPEAISILAPPEYLGAVRFIPPVVLAYLFMCGACLMDCAFYVQARTDLKLWISLASAAIMLALYVLLIPPFKGLGAAYATLFGYVARMALTYLVSQRLLPVSYEWWRLATVFLAAFVCGWIGQFATGPFWLTMPAKTMILLLFPASLWLTGWMTAQEKQALFEWLERARRMFGKWEVPLLGASREP